MINIENLTKSYGERILFDKISFNISSGERVGLVGRNGHGKTTLFRLIAGLNEPDSGTIGIPKNYTIGYVRQIIKFTKQTILEEAMTGLAESEKDHYWKAEKILAGLGFSAADMNRSPKQFSGGFQVRLNLAKVLVSEPDLLLLDEPTNYLDIESIRWTTKFLNNWKHELLLITHDRSFMDGVITHVLGIHRKKVRKITGNTEKYYAQTAKDEEIYEKTRINDEKRRKDMELFINRFRAKARLANLVQSRIKTLNKIQKKEKLENLENLEFSFRYKPFSGKVLMNVENLNFGYTKEKEIIKDFNIAVNHGECICIVGKNGKGKTTLLKLLAENLAANSGNITFNPNTAPAFFEQTNVKTLNDQKSVYEEILYSHPDIEPQNARNICGAMMFSGDDALKKIAVLSGGEKSRVMLGKILVQPANLLFLDEPTNHLDMDSCDALIAAIDAFQGSVIMVTHNQMFLHALADRLIVFQKEEPYLFNGSYQEFLDKIGWDDNETSGNQKSTPKINKKEIKRKRSEIIGEKSRVLKPLEQKIKHIENEVEKAENFLANFNQSMIKASKDGNSAEIAEFGSKIHNCQKEIDELFDKLENFTAEFEEKRDFFESKLSEIDISA